MKKKTLLCTTIAGTMFIAGLAMPGVRATVGEKAKAIIREDRNSAFIELSSNKDVLTREDLKNLVNTRYEGYGATVAKIADEEITEENKGKAVGTGAKVELDNGTNLHIVVYGDVDGDGEVGTYDLDILSQVLVGKETLSEETKTKEAADIADDENVDTMDLDALSQYLVKDGTLVAENKLPEEDIKGNVRTVHFIDTKFNKNQDVRTDGEGKISNDKTPALTDETEKYRLLGWTKDTETNELVDFETEEINDNINLYSVWVRNVKAVITLHYDGEKISENGAEKDKVVKLENKYLAGDTIDLTSGDFELNATHTTTDSGVTYKQGGWYMVAENKAVKLPEKYTIPVPEEKADEEAAEEEPDTQDETVVIDLHPVWDVTVDSYTALKTNEITKICTDVKAAQTAQQKCSDIHVNAEVTVDKPLNIEDGLHVEFNNDVTVNSGNATIAGDVTTGEHADIIKLINNADAGDNTYGLNKSLNTPVYDVVRLNQPINSFTATITIDEGTESTLDLARFSLTKTTGAIINKGKLTIIGQNNGRLTAQGGITNNGILTIGEITSSAETAQTGPIIESGTSGTAITITNTNLDNSKPQAELIINAGTIQNNKTSGTLSAIKNNVGANVTLNGGTIKMTGDLSSTAAVLDNAGTAIITDGAIQRAINNTSRTNAYVINNTGDLEIKGGEFSANNSTVAPLIENGYASRNGNFGKDVNLQVSGGTFTGGLHAIKNDYAGDAIITGGKYEAKGTNNSNNTKSIFKTIGEMTIDFSTATSDNTSINLGSGAAVADIVIVGDKTISIDDADQNRMVENKITVHPFDPSLVTLNGKKLSDDANAEEALNHLIVVERPSTNQKAKSEIIVHVAYKADPTIAGQEFLTLISKYVAKSWTNSTPELNKVKIVLDSDVEITDGIAVGAHDYKLPNEGVTLDLNGHTLSIPSIYDFVNKIAIEDKSEAQTGRIILKGKEGNSGRDLFVNGALLSSEEMQKLAEDEKTQFNKVQADV